MVVGPVTIDKFIGKSIFKTFCSSSNVIKGKYRLRKARQASDISASTDSNPWKNPEKHVMSLGKLYDNSLIDSIQSKFTEAIQNDKNIRKNTYGGEVYSRQIHSDDTSTDFDIATDIPELSQLIDDRISELVTQYYGAHFKPDFVSLYRNYHIPPEVNEQTGIYSDRWHMDSYALDGLKMFVNLSDVTEDHGPFHVISRDDTKNLVRGSFDRQQEGIPGNVVEKNADIIKATGEAGTTMFANVNQCLHRASSPAEGNHRDLIMINFLSSEEPFSDDWLRSYRLDKCRG